MIVMYPHAILYMFLTYLHAMLRLLCYVHVSYIFHKFLWPGVQLTRFSIWCPNKFSIKDTRILLPKIL